MHEAGFLTQRKVHFFTGKGGVGKTFCACAWARYLAQQQKRVLLAELNAGDRIARTFGSGPTQGEIRSLDQYLHIVDVRPRKALREYALMLLKWRSLYNVVFENRIVSHFLEAIPGLSELLMLGKLAYHAEQEGAYEYIVIDGPATGHAISFLATPDIVVRSIPRGPLAEAVGVSQRLIHDAERFCVHVVTIPEELPVTETFELTEELMRRGIPMGLLLLNHCSSSLELPLQHVWDGDFAAGDVRLQHVKQQLYFIYRQQLQRRRLSEGLRPPDMCFPTMLSEAGRGVHIEDGQHAAEQMRLIEHAAAILGDAIHNHYCQV